MNKAMYLNNGIKKYIKANEITPKEYQEIYKGKIYCETEYCNAKLIHQQIDKKRQAHFKTLQGEEHIESCPNNYDKVRNKSSYVYSYIEDGLALSKKHVEEVLRDTHKKMNGKLKINASSNIKSDKKSNTTNSNKKEEKKIQAYDKKAKIGNKTTATRQPPVFKKTVKEFLESKTGTYSVYGDLVDVEINENDAYLTLKEEDSFLRLFCGNIFISNSESEFKLLKHIQKYVNKKGSAQFVAICHYNKQGDEIIGEIIEHTVLYIEGLKFYSFIKKTIKEQEEKNYE